MSQLEVCKRSDDEGHLSVDHLILVAVDKFELNGAIAVRVAQLRVRKLNALEVVVLVVDVPLRLEDLRIIAPRAAVDLEEVGRAELALPNVVAARHVLSLDVQTHAVAGIGLLVAKQLEVSASLSKRQAKSLIRSLLDNVCKCNLAAADVFHFAVRVHVVTLEFKQDLLPEIVDHIEVVFILRVKVVVDYFSVVDLGPVLLILLPLHLEGHLSVRFVAALVQVLQLFALHKDLHGALATRFFDYFLLADSRLFSEGFWVLWEGLRQRFDFVSLLFHRCNGIIKH